LRWQVKFSILLDKLGRESRALNPGPESRNGKTAPVVSRGEKHE